MYRLLFAFLLLLSCTFASAQEGTGKPRVIVGSFDNRGSREDDILRALEVLAGGKASVAAREVRERVTSNLVNSKRYEVYSPRDLERVMRENRELRGSKGMVRIGELTGARYYLTGHIAEAEVKSSMNVFKNFDATVRVSAQVLDLTTGEVIKVIEATGRQPKTTLKSGDEGRKYELSDSEKDGLIRDAARMASNAIIHQFGRLKLEGGGTPAPNAPVAPAPVPGGIDLEVVGFESLGQSRDFERALEHLAGVDKVERLDYKAGTARFRLHGKLESGAVGEGLEESAKIADLGLRAVVDEEKPGRLKVTIKKK
jgi:curli biogenesis system outer membrane secretion channel CsgG